MQKVNAAQKANSFAVQLAELTVMFSLGVGVGVIFSAILLLKFGC